MKNVLIVSLAMAAVLAAAPATASQTSDPDDVSAPLDIEQVRMRRLERGDRAWFTIKLETYESFSNGALNEHDDHFALSFAFDIDTDEPYDRVIQVSSRRKDGRWHLFASMRTSARSSPYGGVPSGWDGGNRFLGDVLVWRPNGRSLMVRFPRRIFDKQDVERFGWASRTVSGNSSRLEADYAPDEGQVVQRDP